VRGVGFKLMLRPGVETLARTLEERLARAVPAPAAQRAVPAEE